MTLWPDNAAAIKEKGLRGSGISGDKTVRLADASTTTECIGMCDLVIIATKAFDVKSAASDALPLIGPQTVVQTIQNGVGSPDAAAQILPEDQMAVGVVGGYGAPVPEPGHAHQIGRASCRERVGQYVYISVVAVPLK